MDKRLKLSEILNSIKGVKKVYFDPPTNTKMEYPCIRYELSDRNANFADDDRYIKNSEYVVIFITRSPSQATEVCNQLESIKYCR